MDSRLEPSTESCRHGNEAQRAADKGAKENQGLEAHRHCARVHRCVSDGLVARLWRHRSLLRRLLLLRGQLRPFARPVIQQAGAALSAVAPKVVVAVGGGNVLPTSQSLQQSWAPQPPQNILLQYCDLASGLQVQVGMMRQRCSPPPRNCGAAGPPLPPLARRTCSRVAVSQL